MCVIVNHKFVVNVMQHRFAIRKKIVEMPRGSSTITIFEKPIPENLRESVLSVLEDKVPGLLTTIELMKGTVEFRQIANVYKDTTFQFNADMVVIVEINLPDFKGTEKELETMFLVKSFWKRPKVWLLSQILDRSLVYQDTLSIATLWYALPELEMMTIKK